MVHYIGDRMNNEQQKRAVPPAEVQLLVARSTRRLCLCLCGMLAFLEAVLCEKSIAKKRKEKNQD